MLSETGDKTEERVEKRVEIQMMHLKNDRLDYRLILRMPLASSHARLADLRIQFQRKILIDSTVKNSNVREWNIFFRNKMPAIKAFKKASNLTFIDFIKLVSQNSSGEKVEIIAVSDALYDSAMATDVLLPTRDL